MKMLNLITLYLLIVQVLHFGIIHGYENPQDFLDSVEDIQLSEHFHENGNDPLVEDSELIEDVENRTGYKLFGDTWLPSSIVESIKSQDHETGDGIDISVLNVEKDRRLRWPRGYIQFEIDPKANYTAAEKQLIYGGMVQWQKNSCIKFIDRSRPNIIKRRNYLFIRNGAGCDSSVGMIGGRQVVNLNSPGCMDKPSVAHELGHAIGLFHMHNRNDRDKHIRIFWNNIEKGNKDQFYKLKKNESAIIGKYEALSVMHYGSLSFSVDQENLKYTMLIRSNNETIPEIENREVGVTVNDGKIVNFAYRNCTV